MATVLRGIEFALEGPGRDAEFAEYQFSRLLAQLALANSPEQRNSVNHDEVYEIAGLSHIDRMKEAAAAIRNWTNAFDEHLDVVDVERDKLEAHILGVPVDELRCDPFDEVA